MLAGWNWARSVLLGLMYFGQVPTQVRLQHDVRVVSEAAAESVCASSDSTQQVQRCQMARPLTLQNQQEGHHW